MKFEPNSKMTTIAIYAFLVLAAAIVFSSVLGGSFALFGWAGRVFGFIQPAVLGFCIAFLLNPMLRTFEQKLLPRIGGKKLKPSARRGVALLLTYLSTLVLIGLFLAIVLPQVIASSKSIAENTPLYFKSLQNLYRGIMDRVANQESLEDPELMGILTNISDQLLVTMQNLLERAGVWLADLGGSLLSFAGNLAGMLLDCVLGIIISVYLLADRERLFAQLRKACAAILPKNVLDLLYGIALDANRVFSGFIIGKIIDSVIIGVLCCIGMMIFRMPYAVLISVIVGVTNVIPYFGPFIGAIPGFLIIVISDPMAGIWFLVFIFLLQQFDGNILGPKILSDTTGLSAFWVIFSIMLFSGLFGIMGMFIGVPLFAVIYLMAKRLVVFLLHRKNLPVDTRAYDTEINPLIK